jgi:hypothetical protein
MPVAALRDSANACSTIDNMEVLTEAEAVGRLRSADGYGCDRIKRKAAELLRDPTANPSRDPTVSSFLESLSNPQRSN